MGTYLEAGWEYNTVTKNGLGGPRAAIEFLDSNEKFLRRYRDSATSEPYAVRGAFGFGGDSLAEKTGVPGDPGVPKEPGLNSLVPGWPETEHFHEIARKETNPERQVIVSNETDFFVDFEKTHGATLPAENVAHGNEWDLYSASMSETSARVKRSVEKLRAAEIMAALVSLQRPTFLQGREKERDQAFVDLGLYWEHDWTADGPVSRERRAAWQELLASEIEYYVNGLHADGATRLGGLIAKPDEKSQRFFVLNPLGWPRTEAADFAYTGGKDIHVRDLTSGQDVPHQIVNVDGVSLLRVLASEVPSAGYKCFEILPGKGSASTTPGATVSGGDHAIFENSRVKMVVEPDGAIASFVDKTQPDKEYAATIDGLKLNDFAANEASGDTPVIENAGPVSVTLRCTSTAGRAHTTRITLYRDSDRVDVRNEITENFRDVRHWTFSFNLHAPDVHTEEVGAVIRVKTKADGGDYADTHARYDYATLNHFADISDGANTGGITLSSPDLAFMRLGHSEPLKLDTATPQLSVLAGGQVDESWLGIRGQNGATRFLQRFALRPHAAYDQTAAMKFALEHQNPLVAGAVIGKADAPYPATKYSMLNISEPNVMLWALKVADDGINKGIIARVWNQANKPLPARFTTGMPQQAAWRTTHIETPVEPLPLKDGELEVTVDPLRMESFSLMLTPPQSK